MPQDCVEVLSLLGAHGGSPFGWNPPGRTQASSPIHVSPLLNLFRPGSATTRLAARQVRKRHRITVIRATGPGAPKVLMVLTPGDRGLEQEQGVPERSGPGRAPRSGPARRTEPTGPAAR